MATVLDAIEKVLREANEPLHYQEITQRILDKGLWSTEGETPWVTINATISLDLRDNDENSRFKRVSRGVYALRSKSYDSSKKANEDVDELTSYRTLNR